MQKNFNDYQMKNNFKKWKTENEKLLNKINDLEKENKVLKSTSTFIASNNNKSSFDLSVESLSINPTTYMSSNSGIANSTDASFYNLNFLNNISSSSSLSINSLVESKTPTSLSITLPIINSSILPNSSCAQIPTSNSITTTSFISSSTIPLLSTISSLNSSIYIPSISSTLNHSNLLSIKADSMVLITYTDSSCAYLKHNNISNNNSNSITSNFLTSTSIYSDNKSASSIIDSLFSINSILNFSNCTSSSSSSSALGFAFSGIANTKETCIVDSKVSNNISSNTISNTNSNTYPEYVAKRTTVNAGKTNSIYSSSAAVANTLDMSTVFPVSNNDSSSYRFIITNFRVYSNKMNEVIKNISHLLSNSVGYSINSIMKISFLLSNVQNSVNVVDVLVELGSRNDFNAILLNKKFFQVKNIQILIIHRIATSLTSVGEKSTSQSSLNAASSKILSWDKYVDCIKVYDYNLHFTIDDTIFSINNSKFYNLGSFLSLSNDKNINISKNYGKYIKKSNSIPYLTFLEQKLKIVNKQHIQSQSNSNHSSMIKNL